MIKESYKTGYILVQTSLTKGADAEKLMSKQNLRQTKTNEKLFLPIYGIDIEFDYLVSK